MTDSFTVLWLMKNSHSSDLLKNLVSLPRARIWLNSPSAAWYWPMRYSVFPSRYWDSSWSGAIFGSFISSQAARAALSYSPRLKEAFAASSRWRSAVRPLTSSASKVVVGAVPFFGGGGGGFGMSCFGFGAGGGADRSSPRSCCALVALAGAAEGAVVAGVVAEAFEDLLELLLFLAFFLGCWGESSPWNAWAEAPAATSSGRRRATGRSERNMFGEPSLALGEAVREEERQPDVEEELVADLVLGPGGLGRALGLLPVDGVAQLEAQRHPAVEDEAHAQPGLTAQRPGG